MQVSLAELEQRAERAVRRGELLAALEHFESYLAHQPDDERVRQRMESVRALLQPSELVSRRRAEPDEPGPATATLSDAEQGEMHASAGRFAEATFSYLHALEKNPRNELLRERLEELRALAGPGARADLGAAEKLEALTPARGVAKARSDKASFDSFAPLAAAADLPSAPQPSAAAHSALPKDPVARLQALLERVRAARRR